MGEIMIDHFAIPSEVAVSSLPVNIRVGFGIPETAEYLIPSSDSLSKDQYGRLVIGRYEARSESFVVTRLPQLPRTQGR